MARAGDELESGLVGVVMLIILAFVALWFIARPGGGLASWLDQQGSSAAGGLSNGWYNVTGTALPSTPSNWLTNFTGWLDSWSQGTPSLAEILPGAGVAPDYGNGDGL
jgi:hypothetical protein